MRRADAKGSRQGIARPIRSPQLDWKNIRDSQVYVIIDELAHADVHRIASLARGFATVRATGSASGSAAHHRSGEAVNHDIRVRGDTLSSRRYLAGSIDVPSAAVRVVIPEVVHGVCRSPVAIGVDELGAFAWRVPAASHLHIGPAGLDRE